MRVQSRKKKQSKVQNNTHLIEIGAKQTTYVHGTFTSVNTNLTIKHMLSFRKIIDVKFFTHARSPTPRSGVFPVPRHGTERRHNLKLRVITHGDNKNATHRDDAVRVDILCLCMGFYPCQSNVSLI